MKRTVLILAALALAGCANLKFQASASYMTDNLAADVAAARAAPQVSGISGQLPTAVKP